MNAPGTTPGTAAAGMQAEGDRWLGWVRIMLHEPATPELLAAVEFLEQVEMAGGLAGTARGGRRLLMVSISAQPSAEKAREALDQVVKTMAGRVGYPIVIETYEDGQ